MADFFFTYEAFIEHQDFILRQGGAESAQAMAAAKAVVEHAKIIASVMATSFISLEMYQQAESHWAHDQYEALVAHIRDGGASGMTVDDEGNIILSVKHLMAVAEER